MKKTVIVLAFIAALFITEKAQAQLNIHAGYAPEMISTRTPTHDTMLFYNGICVGLDWEFKLTDKLSLTAGAQYRMNVRDNAEHISHDTIFVHHTIRERQTLIDIPILLKFNIPAGSFVTISPFAGSLLSWGINGKTSETRTYPENTESHHEWYGENGYMNRFNVYAMAGLEMEFKKFTISFSGRYGFLNLNNRNTGTTTKAYGFLVSVGHTF